MFCFTGCFCEIILEIKMSIIQKIAKNVLKNPLDSSVSNSFICKNIFIYFHFIQNIVLFVFVLHTQTPWHLLNFSYKEICMEDLWKDQRCVIIFFRRWGWPYCRLAAREISAIQVTRVLGHKKKYDKIIVWSRNMLSNYP